ncbi:MAG: hybrid sensor histidine kinase/response regulator [Candidatus Eremiobacteraeota bacterium]|nr:hybrid sensor histidine kinase/response regulator [Candidatus Eremiobacteraeota bacterium]
MSNKDINQFIKNYPFSEENPGHPDNGGDNGKTEEENSAPTSRQIDCLSKRCKSITVNGECSQLLSSTFKIVNTITNRHTDQMGKLKNKHQAEIHELKKYVRELEETSKSIGKQNLVLSYFYQAGQMLSSSLDPRQIIKYIVQMIASVFEGCFCCLFKIDDDNTIKASIRNPALVDDFTSYFNTEIKMKLGEGCEGRAVGEAIPYQIFDVYSSHEYKKFLKLADAFHFQSVLSVPLIVRSEVEGCISIYSFEKKYYSEEETRILTMFSDQASRVIENARLYQKTDEDLRVRIKELSLMHRIDQSIINNESIRNTAEILIDGLKRVLPECGFALDLARMEENIFCKSPDFEEMGINLDTLKAMAGKEDRNEDIIREMMKNDRDQFILYSFPVIAQSNRVGILWITTKEVDGIEKDTVEFIEWVLAQVSIALEKKNTLEQLLHAEKMGVMGSLLSGIAHELNNPLTRMLGLSETFNDMKDPDVCGECFEIIRQESLRCKRIMDDFLSFSRKYRDNETLADINETIESTLNLWKYQKNTKKMKIVTKLQDNMPGVLINVNRIQQVFLNLIVNANHALMNCNGKNKLLVIRTQTRKKYVRITFEDNGPGIPQENIGKIFQAFFTTRKNGKGTGLGLSLSRDILKKHNGDIRVETSHLGGAKFVVELPIKENAAPEKTRNVVKEVSIRSGHILIAEDDPVVSKLMIIYLKRLGHNVEGVNNGTSCLASVKSNEYDLVISDMIMSDIRGDEMIEIWQKEKPGLLNRLILCTGDILDKKMEEDFKSRGINILYKPFEMVELKKIVEKVLSLKLLPF